MTCAQNVGAALGSKTTWNPSAVQLPRPTHWRFRMPMQQRSCLQPTKSALPCWPWPTNSSQASLHSFKGKTANIEVCAGLSAYWVCLPAQLISNLLQETHAHPSQHHFNLEDSSLSRLSQDDSYIFLQSFTRAYNRLERLSRIAVVGKHLYGSLASRDVCPRNDILNSMYSSTLSFNNYQSIDGWFKGFWMRYMMMLILM